MFDRIVVGAGAAGLYYAANCPARKGLLIEKAASPGQKLLLAGSGQCNLTHGGSIKEFIGHYGQNGPKIRSALYRGNNLLLMKFFTDHGIPLTQRADGKVFPRSMEASQVLEFLLKRSIENGWQLKTNCSATSLDVKKDGTFLVNDQFRAEQVVIATGGCSYPATGSDGSIFPILEDLGLEIVPVKPALVPITVQQYPYGALSGIGFQNVCIQIDGHRISDDLLLTHNSFSGPAILNLSRYARPGSDLNINYCPAGVDDLDPAGNSKKSATFFAEQLALPKRFLEVVLKRIGIDPAAKASSLSGKAVKAVKTLLANDQFSVSGTSGFGSAMATSGGVSLKEVDLKTFQSKKYPGLYIIGEALDIDGDTGGYNLQFAFSSGYGAATCVL